MLLDGNLRILEYSFVGLDNFLLCIYGTYPELFNVKGIMVKGIIVIVEPRVSLM
jgi:hypothetical protein